MKLKYPALIATIVAAVATQGVMAQDATSAPKSRADVRAETKAAVKAGEAAKEGNDIQNIATPKAKGTEKKSLREARAKERAEVKDALKKGEIPPNELQDVTKPK